MARIPLAALLLAAAGCQTAGVAEPIALKPLPADGRPLPFADALDRARRSAMNGTEALYADDYARLLDVAKALDDSVKAVGAAPDVPAERKASVAAQTAKLAGEVGTLREAALAKDAERANRTLARIHFGLRSAALGQ